MKKFFAAAFPFRNIDIPLLIFLILFLDVKFIIKVVAILFIVLYDRNFQFGFSRRASRLPLFYLLIILLELFKFFFTTRDFHLNYYFAFAMGILQWGFCLLAIHHLRLRTDRDPARIHDTIKVFYVLNLGVSLFFFCLLLFHPSALLYWGHGKGISINSPSAGDTILGISFDVSTVNATINCLGLIYFLYKKDTLFTGICLLVIVLCTSNATCILLTGTLVIMVLTVRSNKLRIRTLITSISLGLLYFLFSTTNREYIHTYFAQLYILNKDPSLAEWKDSVEVTDSAGNVHLEATPIDGNVYNVNKMGLKKALLHLLALGREDSMHRESSARVDSIERGLVQDSTIYPLITDTDYLTKPGKLISFAQTYVFLGMNTKHFLFGSGIGNFSSKLAFRTSGENVTGTFPRKYRHVSPEFRYNHLKTYQFYARGPSSLHSVLNFPFSVYNQLLGEYGVIGLLLFAIFYLGYFISRYRRLSYGRYMILLLLGFFLMEYWFEMFSLVVFFELFLLLNIKEGREPGSHQTVTPR
jgi:hypothetical protein